MYVDVCALSVSAACYVYHVTICTSVVVSFNADSSVSIRVCARQRDRLAANARIHEHNNSTTPPLSHHSPLATQSTHSVHSTRLRCHRCCRRYCWGSVWLTDLPYSPQIFNILFRLIWHSVVAYFSAWSH